MNHSIYLKNCLLILALSCSFTIVAQEPAKLTFMLKHNILPINDSVTISLNWNEVNKRLPAVSNSSFVVKNLNNDKIYNPRIVDTDNNGTPDIIEFSDKLVKNEPIVPFQLIIQKQENVKPIAAKASVNNDYSIMYFRSATDYNSKNKLDGKWAQKIANSIIETYPNPKDLEIFKAYDWNYTNGFYINGLCELFNQTKDSTYINYASNWVNLFITADGSLDKSHIDLEKYELDEILPGRAFLYLNEKTKNNRYEKAATELIEQLKTHPRTKEGGFWHKKVYTNQMWLDGIYMGDVYLLQYAKQFNQTQWMDDAINQFLIIHRHLFDPKTGLYYHGWDESINKVWSNPQTGASPEFWGRGIGWYAMALADALDYIPANHPKRDSIVNIFQNLAKSLANYQDKQNGLWYQVVDKGNQPDNWIETSACAMFAYAFAKGSKQGILDQSYYVKALFAFEGLKNDYIFFDDSGKAYLTSTVKVGTLSFKNSDGSYKYYIGVDRRINDFKGVAALLYLCMELEK